jgi:hypothetical protein
VVTIGQRHQPDWPSPITAMVDLPMLVVCEGGLELGRVRQSGLQVLLEGIAP